MQQLRRLVLGLAFGVVLAAHGTALARPDPCPGVLFPGGDGVCPSDGGAAVAACCPCGDPRFRNHGRYVSCVAHATNALRNADCLDAEARRSLKRCAARSTCNKPEGFVTCCVKQAVACEDGACVGSDPPLPCATSDECPPTTRCSIKRGEDLCLIRGGVPGTGSCCAACGG